MTTPSKDLLATSEGVDEGSATVTDEDRAGHEPSTEELTGSTNPTAPALGDAEATKGTSESTPAPPVSIDTSGSRDAAGPGQQLEAGEG